MSNAPDIHPDAMEHTDAWHSHAGEAPPQEMHGTVSPFMIAMYGVVGTVVTVAMILITVFHFDRVLLEERVMKKERWDVRGEVRSAEAQWRQEMVGYRWVDAEAGAVGLPMPDAIRSVATEYAGR